MSSRFVIEFDMIHPEFWLYNCGAYNSQTNRYEQTHAFKYGGNSLINAQKEISRIRRTYSRCKPYNFIIYDCANSNRYIKPIIAHISKKG